MAPRYPTSFFEKSLAFKEKSKLFVLEEKFFALGSYDEQVILVNDNKVCPYQELKIALYATRVEFGLA